MQNAKDTFYQMLRDRLAALNPERTLSLRGVTRPGSLVEENELITDFPLPDCFRLRWIELSVDAQNALPLVTAECAIEYETAGSANSGGMDRGRALAAMDAELLAAVSATPQHTPKMNYTPLTAGQPAITMQTDIWWGQAVFGPQELKQNRLARVAKVMVMSYQEAGEP